MSESHGNGVSVSLQIPLENPKKPPLPLCDISCGGWEMSDQSGRYPYLWGVSQQGQVSELRLTSESEQGMPFSFTFRKVKDHMRVCRIVKVLMRRQNETHPALYHSTFSPDYLSERSAVEHDARLSAVHCFITREQHDFIHFSPLASRAKLLC